MWLSISKEILEVRQSIKKNDKFKGHISTNEEKICNDISISQDPILENLAVVERFVEQFLTLDDANPVKLPTIDMPGSFEQSTKFSATFLD